MAENSNTRDTNISSRVSLLTPYIRSGRLTILSTDGGYQVYISMKESLKTKNDKITFDLMALEPYVRSNSLLGFSKNMDFIYKLWNLDIPDAIKLVYRRDGDPNIGRIITVEKFLEDLIGKDPLIMSIDKVDSKQQRFIEIVSGYDVKHPSRMAIYEGNFLRFVCPWDPFTAKGYRNLADVEEVFKSIYGMDLKEYHRKVNLPYADAARKTFLSTEKSRVG